MYARICLVNLTFADMLQISLRNSLNVLNFFYEALAHFTYQFVLFLQALVEYIFLLLRLGLTD